jgi:hypothetical protein
MKKVFKNFIALSLGLALVATGCKKDDNYAKDIAGAYVGTITQYEQPVADGVTINVAEKNATTATLSLNTTLPNLPVVGNLPLNVSCDVTVAKSGDNYTVSGNTTVPPIAQLGDEPLPVTVTGIITPAGKADLTIGITLGVPISVVFSGTKQ